jgi:hypothetical protein
VTAGGTDSGNAARAMTRAVGAVVVSESVCGQRKAKGVLIFLLFAVSSLPSTTRRTSGGEDGRPSEERGASVSVRAASHAASRVRDARAARLRVQSLAGPRPVRGAVGLQTETPARRSPVSAASERGRAVFGLIDVRRRASVGRGVVRPFG